MKALILALAGCLTAVQAAGPLAGVEDATAQINETSVPFLTSVTIPYSELCTLWTAVVEQARQLEQLQQSQPPVAAFVLSGEYELRGGVGAPVLQAAYLVRTLTDDWHLVPLLGGDVRLEQVELVPTGASVLWEKGQYCLLTNGKGDHEVTLGFVPATATDWSTLRELRLRPAPSALNHLRVAGLPDGMLLRIPDLTPQMESGGTQRFNLPVDSPELLLICEPELPPEVLVPDNWSLYSEVLIACGDGRLIYRVRIQAHADRGSGTSLDLLLPQEAESAQVNGEDLRDWRLGSPEFGRRPLHLVWNTRDRLSRIFQVDYEVAHSPLATRWVLQAPQSTGTVPPRTRFVLLPVDGLELRGGIARSERSSWRLPEWMRAYIRDGDYLTGEGGPELEVALDWLPHVQTAQAMVTRANFQSRIVEDGSVLINADWTLQHEAPLNWRLRLPAVDQLLTCQVNRQNMQPIRRDAQTLEIALAAPEQGTSQVAFAYAVRLSALDSVSGSLLLELPQTDLFVHELHWLIHLPESYETTALEGNVHMVTSNRVSPEARASTQSLLQLQKQLLQGEIPQVEIHYQRRGLADDHPMP